MVNAVYDHIVAILVVGAIFVATVVVMPTMSLLNFQAVDQQQLRNTALNVLDAMLLGTGSPSDWGSKFPFDQNKVETFGLAYSEESSLYVLDADKVQRLDKESPGYIEYLRVRDLLKLKGYGFNLNLFRPFTVDWDLKFDVAKNDIWFAVNVTRSEDGSPIPNAQINITIMVAAKNINNDEPIAIVTKPETFFTNALGRCEGNETVHLESGYQLERAVAVMKITVAGLSTMVVAQTDQTLQKVLKINTFGDTITLTFRGELLNDAHGERRVYDIMSYNYYELIPIYDGRGDPVTSTHITHGYGFDYWNNTFPGLSATDPILLLFTVSIPNPRRLVIIVGPFSFWDSSKVFSFGPDSEQVSNVAIKIRRFVVISGMTYIAELTLWKE